MAKVTKCSEFWPEDENCDVVARNLFSPENKNPYNFRGKELKNLDDLKDNLQHFKDSEAVWVADWLGYLGDTTTATQIRRDPKQFKTIITMRHRELLNHLDC